MTESPRGIDGLDSDELKALVVERPEERADLKTEIDALRREIARLKGRPKLEPSGMPLEARACAKRWDK